MLSWIVPVLKTESLKFDILHEIVIYWFHATANLRYIDLVHFGL
jgi:hypothetical protein